MGNFCGKISCIISFKFPFIYLKEMNTIFDCSFTIGTDKEQVNQNCFTRIIITFLQNLFFCTMADIFGLPLFLILTLGIFLMRKNFSNKIMCNI